MTTPQSLINALWPGAWDNDKAQAPIVPCKKADKVPLIPWKKYQDSPPDILQIKQWAAEYPECNWALMTGRASGIVVLDLDDYITGTDWLRRSMLKIPKTVAVSTGKERYHYYFQWPGRECHNFAKRIPGFDFRGDGGYVIAPGSIHPDGHRYQWLHGGGPDIEQIALCPDWLLVELFGEKVNPLPAAAQDGATFATISLLGQDIDIPMSEYERRMIDALAAGVPKGSRNQTAFCVAMFLLDRGFGAGDMRALLTEFNSKCAPALNEKEFNTVTISALNYYEKKKHIKKYQKEIRQGGADGRKRGIQELSDFLGFEIVDVFQTPSEDKTISIVVRYEGNLRTSTHSKITGYKSWANEFAQQTLLVPMMPDKVTTQFSNDFLRLLYSVARVRELIEGGTKESQVKQAIARMIDEGLAAGRENAVFTKDRRGVSCFTAYEEGEFVVFHVFQLKDFIAQVTTDLITDRELAKILTDMDCQLKTILICGKRARAWHVKKSLYI